MSRTVAVAVSGGRDSMALLHCTARTAQASGLQVVALHVHHGLMPAADDWASFVELTCRRWAKRGLPLSFAMTRLSGRPARGDSVEAWARAGRYRALAAMAQAAGAGAVLLAHHRGDQAETFLLQALRGAGAAGLASMPRSAERQGIVWLRPWLERPREAIEAYARRHRIGFVDDPSNADARFARSRLRQQVMPALRAAFGDAEQALAAAAREAALASALQDEVARADLEGIASGAELDLAAWGALGPARRRNALRAWLSAHAGRGATLTALERLLDEVPSARTPATWDLEGLRLRRYRGRLRIEPAAPAVGTLRVTPAAKGGMPRALLDGATWRARQGGEQFQRRARTPPRSLKKQFQAAAVPAWAREGPLLWAADGQLLFVPGLGTDARALAQPGSPRVRLDWVLAADRD